MANNRATKSGLGRETQMKVERMCLTYRCVAKMVVPMHCPFFFGKKMVWGKILAKYNPELAHECLVWLQDMINSSPMGGDEQPLNFDTSGSMSNFAAVLKDGTILARMANVLQPGSIPRKKYEKPPRLAFKQMELIELFIDTIKMFGVPDEERFQTVDLYEEQSLYQVLLCLQTLARKASTKGLKGFGPKEADACPRRFTEEQLRSGSSVIGLQMGTNKGASQKGMTFGKSRMIID